MKKILMITGSLRKNSFNRQLSEMITELIGTRAEVTVLDYSDIPFFNEDFENPPLESVLKARQAVIEADGIWICTPEYNYNLPGVLKNLLDWFSRPADPDNRKSDSVMKGKPVTIASAAGNSAGGGVRKQLATLLQILGMKVVGGDGTGTVLNKEMFVTGTLTLPEEVISALETQIETFLSEI